MTETQYREYMKLLIEQYKREIETLKKEAGDRLYGGWHLSDHETAELTGKRSGLHVGIRRLEKLLEKL